MLSQKIYEFYKNNAESLLKNKGLYITILTVFVSALMQFLFIRYASNSINKIDYGNFVLLQTMVAGLSSIFLQIPSQSFERFYNHSENKVEFINEFRVMLIVIDVLSFITIVIYSFFYDRFSLEILFLLFFYFVLLNAYTITQKIILFNIDRVKYFYLKLLEGLAKFIFPIIFYHFYHSLESILYGIVIGYSLSFFLSAYFTKEYKFFIVVKWENLKKYFLFAYPSVFVSIFTWGISFSDRYFIDYFLTTKEVAIYSLLAMVAGIGQIICQIYFMYSDPKILKLFEKDKEKTFKTIHKYMIILLGIFIILTIIAFILPKFFYTLLLEKDIIYNNYYFYTMMVLLVAIFVNILHMAYSMKLKLIRRLNVLAYILFIALIINLILNYLFIKEYGIIAAAIATLISYLSMLLMQIIYIKYINIKNFEEE